jgi:hypothetical protein
MSRHPHEPDEKDRKTVETMASHGIPHIEIAQVVGITLPTMYKWYRNELDTGATKANSMVAQSLYQKALGNGNGAVAACIFWLKVRAGWVEPRPEEAMPGRKELQQRAAATAGGPSTEWANDLNTDIHAN